MNRTPDLLKDVITQQPEYYEKLKDNIHDRAQTVIYVSGLLVSGNPSHPCNFTVRYLFDEECVILDTDYQHYKYVSTGKWSFNDFLEILEMLKKMVDEAR